MRVRALRQVRRTAAPPDWGQLMKKPQTAGVCQLCNAVVTKAGMTRHLAKCLASPAPTTAPGKGRPRKGKLFHLLAQGKYNPWYWLHLEIPATATLRDLDDFLRDIWLECCGHLSAFHIGKGMYSVTGPMDDFPFDVPERDMNVRLGEVLRPGMKFTHEYDFGSTTDLDLKVVGEREGTIGSKGKVRLLARNEPPAIPCDKCGKPA